MKALMQLESEAQFKMLLAQNQPVMFYFTKPNCNGCHTIFNKLANLVESFPVTLCKINVDDFSELAQALSVFSHPTLIVMVEGKEVTREVRFIQLEKVKQLCEGWVQ